MIKRLVRHEEFGEGRVIAQDSGALKISFFEMPPASGEQIFSRNALESGFLTPVLLERGRRCVGPEGTCAVIKVASNGGIGHRSYEVRYETGAVAVCSEAD